MTELPAEVDEQPPLAKVRGRQRSVTFDISASAVAKIVVGLLALGFIGDLAGQMRDVFVWTLAAAFLAIALNPLVGRLEPRLGRRPAATFVFLGFVVGFLAIVAALVVPFVTQVDQLSTGLPQAISDAAPWRAAERRVRRVGSMRTLLHSSRISANPMPRPGSARSVKPRPPTPWSATTSTSSSGEASAVSVTDPTDPE